jgi:hypothetical protein
MHIIDPHACRDDGANRASVFGVGLSCNMTKMKMSVHLALALALAHRSQNKNLLDLECVDFRLVGHVTHSTLPTIKRLL